MRLLITGADGFTGKCFIDRAIKFGHKIHALKSDLLNFEGIQNEISEFLPEGVVHLGAISSPTHQDSLEFYKVNVIGTTNLLEALSSVSLLLKKVLIASSASVYGNSMNSPVSEESTPFPNNHYSCSKLSMEFLSLTYTNKLPICIARPFNYTGLGQNNFFVIAKIVSHFREKLTKIELGNIKISREFNDVRFVCDAYLGLLEKAKVGEVYNICTGTHYSLEYILDLLIKMTENSIQIVIAPDLFRKNEISKIYGSNEKLELCIGNTRSFTINETLLWMLNGDLN
ncbi:GDP-mannose 4,6-dehydratase [Candidatus Methylopumilus planktonicus]|uniref:GDP-mannose 4,6-dehydratase n=1 Tax=Candidatus Methylopumilus planktonicus TaxID=1581557 RepID=UPI003BEEF29F